MFTQTHTEYRFPLLSSLLLLLLLLLMVEVAVTVTVWQYTFFIPSFSCGWVLLLPRLDVDCRSLFAWRAIDSDICAICVQAQPPSVCPSRCYAELDI